MVSIYNCMLHIVLVSNIRLVCTCKTLKKHASLVCISSTGVKQSPYNLMVEGSSLTIRTEEMAKKTR
jgi:hypothetical protein